jgi:hypothetical protein
MPQKNYHALLYRFYLKARQYPLMYRGKGVEEANNVRLFFTLISAFQRAH